MSTTPKTEHPVMIMEARNSAQKIWSKFASRLVQMVGLMKDNNSGTAISICAR
jgi:hypothetical protein